MTSIEAAFREIVMTPVIADGLTFDTATVSGQTIKEEEEYEGVRIRLIATLMGARIPVQIDVGFGDVVTPSPEEITFPTLLDAPAPQLRSYPRETVIAEKFEAIVKLDYSNSRMKDFYDVWVSGREGELEASVLRGARHF